MGSPGYVYVLINPSISGSVKIGKTTRDSAARAAELSASTGVPTPFVVAYECYFPDCNAAEQYIHALLESQGVRLAANREFFAIEPTDAINAVIRAKDQLTGSPSAFTGTSTAAFGVGGDSDEEEFHDPDLLDLEPSAVIADDGPASPWEDLLDQAFRHEHGDESTLPDPEEAIRLYKMAAKLGSADAYLRLGELCADAEGIVASTKEGIMWLKRGADRGLPECWVELAAVFRGEQIYYSQSARNLENARRCYRRFFKTVAPLSFDAEGSRLYRHLRVFLAMIGRTLDASDREALATFVPKFQVALQQIPREAERVAKRKELESLQAEYSKC